MGSSPTAVVIGAGMGGLACAIDLARQGVRVEVLEAAARPGGKARTVRVGGDDVDAGPTVITMPEIFDELFDAAGATFRSELALERADVLARHVWADGTQLDFHRDRERTADAIGAAFGRGEARAYLEFCAATRSIYAIAERYFLRSQRMTLPAIVQRFGAGGLRTLTTLDAHRTMWRALVRRFAEPRLVQLFGRYATYCGSSPFEAPATLNLVAHVEAEGVYRARGGIAALVGCLARLACALGVEIRCDHHVERIVVERGRVVGVVAKGELHRADTVVFNGDVSALGLGLLGDAVARAAPPTRRGARSLSAVTWAMQARASGVALHHHNVFFAADEYRLEFDAIFREGTMPREPTVYICAQDRSDDTRDRDSERLLVVVNAPPLGDDAGRWSLATRERCRTSMERTLGRAGLTLLPTAIQQTTPVEFERLFPGTGGALYGPRSKGATSVLSRAGAATKLPGLYLVGGSIHPGAGVPLATLSGRLAAAQILADRGSTARSRSAVTSGTTSTE